MFIRSVCFFVCLFVCCCFFCKNPLVALATLTKLSFFPLKNKERLTPFLSKVGTPGKALFSDSAYSPCFGETSGHC